PEQASTRTSFLVPMKSFRSASTRVKRLRKSAVRWCAVQAASANCAAGRRGVGPGVNRRVLRSMNPGPLNDFISGDVLQAAPDACTHEYRRQPGDHPAFRVDIKCIVDGQFSAHRNTNATDAKFRK